MFVCCSRGRAGLGPSEVVFDLSLGWKMDVDFLDVDLRIEVATLFSSVS